MASAVRSLYAPCWLRHALGYSCRSNGPEPAASCLRLASCAAAFLLLLFYAQATPAATRQSSSLQEFERAEQLHEALESRPAAQRGRPDYERVLDAYRAVYHGNPASSKAVASINAVAALLVEEGRLFQSQARLRDAIGQYEFLRREYPTSSYRFSALIAEGEIYHTDLGDLDQASAKFREFLKSYPRNRLAGQARSEIEEIREEATKKNLGDDDGPIAGVQEAQPPAAGRSTAAHGAPIAERSAVSDPALPAPATAQRPRGGSRSPVATSEPVIDSVKSPSAVDLSAEVSEQSPPSRGGPLPRVTGIRHWSTPADTRIAIDLEDQVPYVSARVRHPDRIYFDLRGARLTPKLRGESVAVNHDGFLQRIRAAQFSSNVTRIVLDVNANADYSAFFLPNPWRLIIDIHSRKTGADSEIAASSGPLSHSRNELESLILPPPTTVTRGAKPSAAHRSSSRSSKTALSPATTLEGTESSTEEGADLATMREAEPTAGGERSLVRALGLKIGRIVIDAGHGGRDCGTLGPGGIQEKDITLDVALRLGKLLKRRLGADVVYTRDKDVFVPLETRTAIANKARADLFISIHVNSSSNPETRGVESYYLNFTASPGALEVAARENASSDQSIYELADLVKKIALTNKIEESREFAADVQKSLYIGLEEGNPGLKDRGVKQAPFVVLIGANMPSILAEISFLTNPTDASELLRPSYRERIADSLFQGVAKYIDGLSGVRLAENAERASGN